MITLEEFLTELFLHYPPSEGKVVKNELEYYRSALKSEKKYNYDKLLQIVAREHSYKTPPLTSWLLDKRNTLCEIRYNPNDQHVILITFENNVYVQATVASCGLPIFAAKETMKGLYGEIKKVQYFPAGTAIIGQKAHYPSGKVVDLNSL